MDARKDYDRFSGKMNNPDAMLTPGYLRLEVANLAATSQVEFTMAENAGAQTITEKRLQLNDAFVMTHIGLFISTRLTADGVSSQVLHSFPNGQVFNTAPSLNAVRAWFNSGFGIRVNSTVLVDGVDVLACLRADTAQQGTAVSAVATTGVVSGSFWGQDSAFKAFTPNLVFNGSGNNIISVQLPESVTFTLANTTVSAVCIVRGWLAQNGGVMRASR